MTTNQPLSLFISSKMVEMQEERRAVQSALAAYRTRGWLWEENAGARPEPIQSTYLKEVEACDIYIGLFWKEYGEYTIEEYQHARKHYKPCLIYVKQVDIEQRNQRLVNFLKEINRVSSGLTVYHFANTEELAEQVQKDMMQLLTSRFRDIRQQPIWNIPFPPKEFFMGRETLLQQLHTRLRKTGTAIVGQRQAINGLGGIGKTQLAVKYAYQYRQEYQTVLWVHADTTEALNTSYTEIARLLQLPQKDAKEQEEIVQGVKDWLSDQQNWLLILDNADEPDVLIPFLPPRVGGHLIVTTRAADISYLGLGFGHALTVQKFTKNQDVPFLLQRAGMKQVSSQERTYARLIADELDGLPLALNQAGVYLARTGSSLASYWEMYQHQRGILLDTHEENDREYPRSVAATLLLSFKRVEQRNPAAADLLRLCAFFAPDAIPEELLTKGARELGDVLAPVAENAHLLNQAFADLRAYSLLIRYPQSRTLIVHRLVQAVLRDSMSIEMHQRWIQRAVLAVNAAFPASEHKTWSLCERLLPHALQATLNIEGSQIMSEEAGRLLHETALYLQDRARYQEAELLYQRALRIREQQLGPEHLDVALTLNRLAHLYYDQSKYIEAESPYQRALIIQEKLLGSEHSDVALTLSGLAHLYQEQGRYTEAEPLYQRARVIQEKQLGSEHPDVALILNGLAHLYNQQGKYPAAEPLYQHALHIREQQLGPEHPDVALTLNGLAVLYHKQGKYAEAEPLYLRALHIWEQQLRPEHPNVAYIVNNLAELYSEQDKYTEAEPLFLRALLICEQELGLEHHGVAYPLSNLAHLYSKQGKYAEAEPLFLRALLICEKGLGPEHPQIADLLNGLAVLYHKQGRYAEAEPILLHALLICEQQLGPEHPDTATSLHNLAALYTYQGKYREAGQLYQRALTIREQVLGPTHIKTTDSLYGLANIYQQIGQYEREEGKTDTE
jgi:tetratricopeptide (TPR) repeat protein